MKVLVTGSGGLVGSEVSEYFSSRAEVVCGIDNNMRAKLFGAGGDVSPNINRLKSELKNYKHFDFDIRDREQVFNLFKQVKFDLIIHAAAQPSHDFAAKVPFEDFSINAYGTQVLLEGTREFCPEAVFIFFSTNKVYGDAPNHLELIELKTRWDYADARYTEGISEDMKIDKSLHSLMGVSKASADLMVQEYGKYFGLKTVCLRGGCLTGARHSGVELHGFLSYLVKCNLRQVRYRIFGYKGKQVRDNIHSFDIATALEFIAKEPRAGEVYNLGGCRQNSCSILEAIELTEDISGIKMQSEYIDQARIGDHICYISNMCKFKSDYPNWKITKDLRAIINEIVERSRDGHVFQ